MKIIQPKILLLLFFALLVTISCFNIKETGHNHKEWIYSKNKLVDIGELYQYNRGEDYKDILRIDSVISGVADTIIGGKKKYEIIYYFHNGTFGVYSWELVRFNDTIGARMYHCHSDKRSKTSVFKIEDVKKFILEKDSYMNKFSYNVSVVFDYRKYLVFKENDKIIFCDILVSWMPDENFESTGFINNYLKTVDDSCK